MKTHWKQLINPDYLGAYSLPEGKDITVTIKEVKREIVTGVGGKKEECTVAHIEGNKPLILNSTNSKTIQKLYGTPYIEDWKGKQITLFSTTTKLRGEDVECLRIRPKISTKTVVIKDSELYYKIQKGINNGFTIEQVKQKYTLTADVEESLKPIKKPS